MSYSIGIPEALYTLTPTAQWSMTNNSNYDTLVWYSADIEKPTKEQIQAEIARLNADKPFTTCKEEAKRRIAVTDWAVLPDVGISNVAEFEAYRASLRALIKNPVQDPVFGTEPQPVWL